MTFICKIKGKLKHCGSKFDTLQHLVEHIRKVHRNRDIKTPKNSYWENDVPRSSN